ncbi:hypothetical protein ABEO75_18845 [Paenibacillus macerans]|uniref:hypothetical protein n=1 Tax=Paenibacillus macerans TaxID=44252 RepID=UPI002E1BD830|nr:hypothetical protein [Paenibacillus macerans]
MGIKLKRLTLSEIKVTAHLSFYLNARLLSALNGEISPVILSSSLEQAKLSVFRINPEIQCAWLTDDEATNLQIKLKDYLGEKTINWNIVLGEEIEQLYERLNLSVDNTNWIVAFTDEPFCAYLAAIRAIEERRPFFLLSSSNKHNEFSKFLISSRPSSIYIVTQHLNHDRFQWLHSQISALSPDKGSLLPYIPYGYLTASNFETMTFIDFKQRLNLWESDMDVVALPSIEAPIKHNNENCQILNRENVSVDFLKDMSYRIFNLTSHGRNDLAFIGQDYLCGKSMHISTGVGDVSGECPMCMKPPFHCLRTDGRKLDINCLRAKHIFINSCGSLGLDDSEFGPSFNLSYSALEGTAESFVGTVRWKDGNINESFLYLYLLRAGYTLGETVVILNLALCYNRYESQNDVFLLLGDPSSCIEHRINEPFETEGTTCLIRMTTPFIQVLFKNRECLKAWDEGNIYIATEGMDNIFCTVYRVCNEDGKKGVMVSLMAPYAESFPYEVKIMMYVRAPEPFEYVRTAYNACCKQLNPVLGLKKFYPQKVIKGIKDDLDNQMINLSSIYKSSYTTPDKSGKLVRQSQKILDKLSQADYLTCLHMQELFSKTNFRFSEHYQDKFMLDKDFIPSQKCYVCGQYVVERRQHSIVVNNVYRNERICYKCGGLEDKPDDEVSLEIWGGTTKEHENVEITLKVENHTTKEISGYACLTLRNSSRWELNVEPKASLFRITPLGQETAVFRITIGETPPHKHSLQAALVINQKVYLAMRPFYVV